MSTTEAALRKALSEDLLETLFRFGLIVFLAVMCARVFAPFASLMIWGLILAVALEPLNAKLAKRLGGRRGLAATVLTLVGLLLLGVPTVMLGNSFATQDRKSTRLNSSHSQISYAVFCLKKKT